MPVCMLGEFKHIFQPIQELSRKIKVESTPQFLPESSVVLWTPLGHKDKEKGLGTVKGNSINCADKITL